MKGRGTAKWVPAEEEQQVQGVDVLDLAIHGEDGRAAAPMAANGSHCCGLGRVSSTSSQSRTLSRISKQWRAVIEDRQRAEYRERE